MQVCVQILLLKTYMHKTGLDGDSPFTMLLLKKRINAFLEEGTQYIKLLCHHPEHMMTT